MKRYALLALCATFAAAVQSQENFNTTPPPITSDFSCVGRPMGFYADVQTNCRAYHTCDDHGNHFTHYCPEDTAFRQDAMICDHAYLVDCQANVNSAPTRRFGQDDNHDAPPSSFVEPRGEGTNARGFARSFRINPDTKNSTTSKYPTFSLNSSVFLTNREPNDRRSNSATRSREATGESTKSTVSRKNYNEDSSFDFQSYKTSTVNAISATPRITISDELQPPVESSRMAKVLNSFQDDEFSFLVPPPVRNDNDYFQKTSFKSSKIENNNFQKSSPLPFKDTNFSFQKSTPEPFKSNDFSLPQSTSEPFKSNNFPFQKSTPEPFQSSESSDQRSSFESLKTFTTGFQKTPSETFKTDNTNSNFFRSSMKPVTFSPRTEMVLEMVKSRGLARESSSIFPLSKPVNFLEPPSFKPDFTTFSRANFNFRNDDYPYVETLRSIQNNKASASTSAFSNPSTKTISTSTNATPTNHVTEASIFAVPTKPLMSAGDVEHDPYYPKVPTTTEAYYTPRQQVDKSKKSFFTTTRRPLTSSAKFEIPAVLPDLNSLEDLLDRRKFFFIPQIKSV